MIYFLGIYLTTIIVINCFLKIQTHQKFLQHCYQALYQWLFAVSFFMIMCLNIFSTKQSLINFLTQNKDIKQMERDCPGMFIVYPEICPDSLSFSFSKMERSKIYFFFPKRVPVVQCSYSNCIKPNL